MKTPINHPVLGGDVVDLRKPLPEKMPQRKPNSSMTGEELLRKAVTGTHKQKVDDVWGKVLKKTWKQYIK